MDYHVAQVNIGMPRAPIDSPLLADFMRALDPINALADESPGFVWRLQTEDGNATAIRPFEDERLMINMSVWESIDDLAAFVYRSAHVDVMRRRREWFEHMRLYMALWWVPAGHVPTTAEARARLDHLAEHGPTPFAFTFKVRFPRPDDDPERVEIDDELGCPA
jgi:heme-degrading monooxygenase HmoA